MPAILAAFLVLVLTGGPTAADQILPPGQIDGNGYLKFRGGPTLGRWQSNKYISTPDALRLPPADQGSTGDVSGMSIPLAGGAVATIGNAVPALDVARSEIGSRLIPLRSFVSNGFSAAGDAGGGARYVRGTSSGFMAVQDAAGTWFQLDLASGDVQASWVGVVAGDPSKAVSNASAINGLMAALAARGGGRVRLPPGNVYVGATLDNAYDYVLVEGWGSPFAGYGNPNYATTLVPTFAGTVFKHRTAAGSNHINNGGGLVGVRVIGNGVATRLVEVDTVWGGRYRFRAEDSVGTDAVYFMGGEIAAISGVCIQHADIDISASQVGTGAASNANVVVFDGGPNSNVSINEHIKLDIVHKNGDALVLKNADNNIIWQRAYRVDGGTGASVRSKGAATEAVSARANIWKFLTANTAAIFEGTESAAYPSTSNIIQQLDKDNGTPMPVLGAGAQAYVLNQSAAYTPTLTVSGGTLGTGATSAGRWHQSASGLVTVFVTITLPNASGTLGALFITLPVPPQAGSIEGSVVGKEIAVTGKAVSGIVDSTKASLQYYDGTLAGQSNLNFRIKIEYQG